MAVGVGEVVGVGVGVGVGVASETIEIPAVPTWLLIRSSYSVSSYSKAVPWNRFSTKISKDPT